MTLRFGIELQTDSQFDMIPGQANLLKKYMLPKKGYDK